MNRFGLLALGTIFVAALTAVPQQPATGADGSAKEGHGQHAAQGVPSVELQLKVLTEKLDLTADQQARIKPVLQELHEASEKLVRDNSMSREERLAKIKPYRYKVDKQLREILSEDQKKKLDQFEQESHPEMHGDLNE